MNRSTIDRVRNILGQPVLKKTSVELEIALASIGAPDTYSAPPREKLGW